MSKIRHGEDLWQWSCLEIRLNTFCWSTIPQEQFIIITIIIIIIIIIIIMKTLIIEESCNLNGKEYFKLYLVMEHECCHHKIFIIWVHWKLNYCCEAYSDTFVSLDQNLSHFSLFCPVALFQKRRKTYLKISKQIFFFLTFLYFFLFRCHPK